MINQSKLFGAVVVKYLELCEMCGTSVDIYYIYIWLPKKPCVFFQFLSWIRLDDNPVMIKRP